MFLEMNTEANLESSLQQYGLNPKEWMCIPTTWDDDSFLVRSKEDPELMFLGRKNPKTRSFQELQLLTL